MKWSDFRGDPYGWATNQATHVLIGAATLYLLGYWGLGVWALWEAWQFWRETGPEKRQFRDGVTDFLFFAWGFAYGVEGWALIAMLAVAVGYIARGGLR